jgi:Protein of unknown function (DUF3828)
MKLRMSLLMALLLICLSNIPSYAQRADAPPSSPEAVIRNFYEWYVHSLNQNAEPLEKQRTILKKYVTERLIREIDKIMKGPDGLDADPFLDAQDWDKDWGKDIAVSSIVSSKGIATAQVTLNGNLIPNHKLRVTLKQERDVWKIDKIKGPDN